LNSFKAEDELRRIREQRQEEEEEETIKENMDL
jgi:hypothetical protein